MHTRAVLPAALTVLLALLALPAPAADPGPTTILLVYTKPDHPWASHMYELECRLLARCLEQTPGVRVATVQDWPADDKQFDGVKAIVYYSRPAGDIVLAPGRRERFLKLMADGVGFAAIHWATAAEKPLGEDYLKVLGGWFHFGHAGLNVSQQRLRQVDPTHPVCRGWASYDLRDEFYLNLKFHEQARPVLTVTVGGKEQVVAWVLERPGSKDGRSFGTTLGHFHDNFRIEAFRRALVNGILWTAHVDVPAAGAPVKASDEDLRLPPPPGFDVIFNGRDLTGWDGSPKYWTVEDGCLTGRADGTLKFNRFIVWRGGDVKNFEVRAQVNVSPRGNSGIQYRGTERPDLGESVVTGYQLDVVAGQPELDGMLYEERQRRILAHTGEKVIIDPNGQPWVVGTFPVKEFKPGEWHEYRALVRGNHHQHWIDGHQTVDVIDLDEKGRKLDGVLGVQVHVGPPMKIQYRDFYLKRLPDGLPLITPAQAPIPATARKVVPQGQAKPK